MPIRVFNADDHPMLKSGVSNLIESTEGLDWVGSASNGKEALEKIRSLKPDVAILDIEMPKLSGLDVCKTLIKENVSTAFILFTLFKNEVFLSEAMNLGIKGYLLKESSEKEVIDCIHAAYEGRFYVSSGMTNHLIHRDTTADTIFKDLTKHEINILKLISVKKTSREIAEMLFISPKTVSNHRRNISRKLKLESKQNGLLQWAIENKSIIYSMR